MHDIAIWQNCAQKAGNSLTMMNASLVQDGKRCTVPVVYFSNTAHVCAALYHAVLSCTTLRQGCAGIMIL